MKWTIQNHNPYLEECYIARYTDVRNKHRESEIHDIHEIGLGTKILFTYFS